MTDVLFYHLTERPLEAALPELLEKTLAKGWRALVCCGSAARRDALDLALWTYRAESFLPHSALGAADAAEQPILIGETDAALEANPNGAQALFLVDGETTDAASLLRFERCCYLFDARDAAATASARTAWKVAVNADLPCIYWAQEAGGRWTKKAEKLPEVGASG